VRADKEQTKRKSGDFTQNDDGEGVA
jgi:hypothetical protein